MRHIFIINPIAGKGAALALEPALQSALGGTGLSWEIYHTRGPGDCEDYVRRLAALGEPLRIYVCGGDGTFHEAVNGAACQPQIALGLFPAGTGNDFVRSFTHPDAFLDTGRQLGGKVRPVDLLQVNQRYTANLINIGFDCEVVHCVAGMKRLPFANGGLAYLVGVFRVLCRRMGVPLAFRLEDGRTEEGRFLLCTAANGQFYGGGFRAAPRARLDDGRLEFAAVRRVGRLRFLSLLGPYRQGSYLNHPLAAKLLVYSSCRQVEITAPQGVNVCMDGEIIPFTRLKIRAVPRALNLILPEGCELLAPMPEAAQRKENRL